MKFNSVSVSSKRPFAMWVISDNLFGIPHWEVDIITDMNANKNAPNAHNVGRADEPWIWINVRSRPIFNEASYLTALKYRLNVTNTSYRI